MESIEKADDDTGLKSLIDLAEACPKFLRPQLDQLFAACIKVFQDVNQEDSWRHLALEVVVTMSETAPAMVRKVAGGQLEAAIAAILRMMTEIDEEDDWATSDEAADDDSDSNAVVAESALDRMACGLGTFLEFYFFVNHVRKELLSFQVEKLSFHTFCRQLHKCCKTPTGNGDMLP